VPFVVVPNGGIGTIFDSAQRPFVTGLVPEVAGWGRARSPRPPEHGRSIGGAGIGASDRAASSAESPDISVTEIRRQQAEVDAAARRESEAMLGRARQAEFEGKLHLARQLYRSALRQVDSSRRAAVAEEIQRLDDKILSTRNKKRG
jgi:hypothetical protein